MQSGGPRQSALFRFHDAALDAGATLTAYARMTVHSHNDLFLSHGRILFNIISKMYDFAFNARKAIERADQVVGDVKELAQHVLLSLVSAWWV